MAYSKQPALKHGYHKVNETTSQSLEGQLNGVHWNPDHRTFTHTQRFLTLYKNQRINRVPNK